MEKLFPFKEKSGNFEQTGKVREFSPKYWENEGIFPKILEKWGNFSQFYFHFFSDFLIEVHLLNTFLYLSKSLNKTVKKWKLENKYWKIQRNLSIRKCGNHEYTTVKKFSWLGGQFETHHETKDQVVSCKLSTRRSKSTHWFLQVVYFWCQQDRLNRNELQLSCLQVMTLWRHRHRDGCLQTPINSD